MPSRPVNDVNGALAIQRPVGRVRRDPLAKGLLVAVLVLNTNIHRGIH